MCEDLLPQTDQLPFPEDVDGTFSGENPIDYYPGLEHLERQVLEMNARGEQGLHELVLFYIDAIEKLHPDMTCSLLECRGDRLYPFASRSLPAGFVERLNEGIPTGWNMDFCGTAAHQQEPMVVTDIARDDRWTEWRDVMLSFGYRACWSQPVIDSGGTVMATFAMYYRTAKVPSALEVKTIERAVHLLQVILESKQREERLQQTNLRYELLAEATHDAVWDFDVERNTCFFNLAFTQLFGYATPAQMDVWTVNIHPEDQEAVLASAEDARRDPQRAQWEMQYRFYRADGSIANVLDRAFIQRAPDGRATRMIGAMQDITRIKQAEAELRRLSLIATETTNGIFMTDSAGYITWVNKAFCELSGFIAAEITGHLPWLLLRGPGTNEKVLAHIRTSIRDKQAFNCELRHYRRDGQSYWLELKGQPAFSPKGEVEHYFAIATDITHRRELELRVIEQKINAQKEISKAIIRTQERERSDIGKELHDNVSQILTTAKLYVENIGYFPERRADFIRQSQELVQRSINEIRFLSKQLVPPVLNDIGFRATLDELITQYLSLRAFHIDFHYGLSSERKLHKELQLTMYRIVQEQLNNIVKYAGATNVEIGIRQDGGMLRLWVADDGTGFDTRRPHKGMGLSDIRNRAEVYRGKVHLDSAPGKGCRLSIELPIR
ncbi:PAS domain S-box protein [Flaviaesturariibacter flavus]|uniref:Oxygen sensor histidine kinase NreB n=1 Tax=Flaviaesturariibacter flavus TaxID=2502780 RepID=A0A4R1B8L5_9BACT|nr:PAS domain S-box protein [Flaviaesturariibacter flavus]TCJ12533.1 PAS domain S-box protein [Flaviaesturariibacter flavus]